ncbi:MAG: IS6 family transposase [Gammaproteobacteria bacterium]|nr:IS6 family transposase [Gammaproteobacteria bacterium]
MNNNKMYSGYRYPSPIISHTVWLYFRFTLSFSDIEELLAARGIAVSYETIRQWCQKFGQKYSHRFLDCHGVVNNLFRIGRHMMKAKNYRTLRNRSFVEWERVSCVQNIM